MSQNKNYDVIVIGAGCGGLTAALCAVKQGKKVLLLERKNTPGGFLGSFVRGRFEFETSMQQLCGFNSTGLGEAYNILNNLDVNKRLKWCSLPDSQRIITTNHSGEKIDLNLPLGVTEFIDTLETYVPGSKESVSEFFALAEETHEALNALCNITDNSTYSQKRVFLKKYPNFVRTTPYSVCEVLNALNMPAKALDVLCSYWFNFGIDCDRLSFTQFADKLYTNINYTAIIPKMRSYALAMSLVSEFEDNGGEIRYNSHVSRIKFNNKQACGVILKNGENIDSNHIICSCSPTTVFGKMIKQKDIPKTAIKRTNARSFGGRSACVYLGLNRSCDELGIKNYKTVITQSSDTAEQYDLMKKIETNNNLTAVCLNIVDPDCSPVGTSILCLSTFYTDNCWANISPEEYYNEKDLLAARLIANYENATGITIYNAIEEIEVATPVTFARYTATPQGVTFGYQGNDWDSLLPRFLTEKTDCDTKGLYFCGAWGTQLSGVAETISSGRNTAYTTLSDISEEVQLSE